MFEFLLELMKKVFLHLKNMYDDYYVLNFLVMQKNAKVIVSLKKRNNFKKISCDNKNEKKMVK